MYRLIKYLEKLPNNSIVALILTLSLLLVVVGFLIRTREKSADLGPNPIIVVTVPPLYDLINELGGDYLQVELAQVTQNQLNPESIPLMQQADLVFANGLGYDTWVKNYEDQVTVVYLDKAADLLPIDQNQEAGQYDPHYWLSIPNMMLISQYVKDILVKEFPERDVVFREYQQELAANLARLDQEFRLQLRHSSQSKVYLVDQSWKYLLRDYGISVVDEFTGDLKDLSKEDMRFLISQIQSLDVLVVVVSRSSHTAEFVDLLAEQGIRTAILDEISVDTGINAYQTIMKSNFIELAAVLR